MQNEPLDAVFSFLSQFELSPEFLAFESDEHAVNGETGVQGALPSSSELLPPVNFSHSSDDDNLFDLSIEELLRDDKQTSAGTIVAGGTKPDEGVSATTNAPTKGKPKRIRISRKHQIESLRKEIQELNSELKSLSPERRNEGSRQCEILWREIAERQFERRQRSEEENGKLRKMLEIQVLEAKNLKRVLKRRSKIEMLEDMLGVKRQKRAKDCVPEDNPQVFKAMLENTDDLYVGINALFVEKGIYDVPCPGRRRDTIRDVTNGLFMELIQRHVMPFSFHTTAKAVWNALRQIGFQHLQCLDKMFTPVDFRGHHTEESSNTLMSSFLAETSNIPCLGDILGAQFRKVVRRYVENDRVVFICKFLVEPVLCKKSKTSDFFTRTTLQIIVRGGDEHNSSKGETSIIDSHFSATRYGQALPPTQIIHASTNLDIGITAWDEAMSQIVRQVESLVVDESCDKLSTPLLTL